MTRPRALDLFCCAGGMSEGLRRAGFEVTGVDIRDLAKHHRGGTFVQADALTHPLNGFDFVHASPPCQAHSSLRHLHPGREYFDLIEPVRERLQAWGGLWSIENVPGAPLGGAYLVVLCGTMFGLETPDGRAEIRRHRLFELSFCPDRQPPPCRHGGGGGSDPRQATIFDAAAVEAARERLGLERREVLTVTGTHGLPGKGARERSVITVTGDRCNGSNTPRRSLSVTGHAIEISPTNWGGRPTRCGVSGCRRDAELVHRSGDHGYGGPDLPVCRRCYDAQVEHYAAAIANREPRKVLTVTGHTPVDNTGSRVICVAGGKAMSGGASEPQGMRKRRAAMSVTGAVPQRHASSDYGKNISRETFSVDDARAAMGMEEPWDRLPMKYLSQAIPPVYGEWIGRRALHNLGTG